MANVPNPWLPVVQRLARDVAVDDYIHDIDGHRSSGAGRRVGLPMRIALVGTVMLIGAVVSQSLLWACGFHLATSAQMRLVEAVYRVDPHAERWSDERLQARLEYRREAMDLIEHTLATPVRTTYPYLSSLSGHPSPLVDPGAASALLLLANALDQFPPAARGHYVQAVVAVALALDDPDLQAALDAFSHLPQDVRKRLVANRAAALMHLFAAELDFQDAAAERDRLQAQLAAEQMALDAELKALTSAISVAQGLQQNLSTADRRCAAMFSHYRACLATAAQLGQGAE